MPEQKIVLRAEHLGINFGGLKAVDDFNLELCEGELVGLIGPNGAGKTTVFNMLTGVYEPTEGKEYLLDSCLNGKKVYQIVAAGIARTFQNIRLFREMTVLENVMAAFTKDIKYGMGRTLTRSGGFWQEEESAYQHAIELLSLFGLQDKKAELATNLPYGQQRKLEIARALATDMKLLLLDEPAAGMNPTETAELHQPDSPEIPRVHPADRARHEPCHENLRAHHRAGLRLHNCQRHPGRDCRQQAGHRRLPR